MDSESRKHEVNCPLWYMREGSEVFCLCGDVPGQKKWFEVRRSLYCVWRCAKEVVGDSRMALGMAIIGGHDTDIGLSDKVNAVLRLSREVQLAVEQEQKVAVDLISRYGAEYGRPAEYGLFDFSR